MHDLIRSLVSEALSDYRPMDVLDELVGTLQGTLGTLRFIESRDVRQYSSARLRAIRTIAQQIADTAERLVGA